MTCTSSTDIRGSAFRRKASGDRDVCTLMTERMLRARQRGKSYIW